MDNDVIVGYHIQEKLYESAQSLVYRGCDRSTNQLAILKILKNEYPTPEKRACFQREYAITRKLGGSGVVEAFKLEKHQNTLVLVMEDFGGKSLDKTLKNRSLDLRTFLQLAIRITGILEHVHQARVIHKDINPSNIVWNSASNHLKLIDFGLSSELPRETPQFINVNSLEGTLAYLSPEQTGRMNRSLDYRTDFYSLGVMLYEMLAGRRPFETPDVLEMVHCHLAKMPLPPCDLVKTRCTVPLLLSDIIMKLLAKNAEDRYQSASGLKKDLQRCSELVESNNGVDGVVLGHADISDRFQIPEKLYGRMQEMNILLQAFERVRAGNGEIMLVTGEPGIGKSSLVYEIHKPITEAQGYFIAGKFDQFQRHIPYYALIQAFQEFVNHLLTEQEDRLALWREMIRQAVGNVGKVLTDVFPNLTLVIGPQAEIPQLAPTEAQNRFNYVFENFVKAISQKEHPLVLFIDDMQWIDSASLNLLTLLMSNQEIHYFLCIGAYRDSEVSPSHPLMMMIEEIKPAQAALDTITLPQLAPEHVKSLILDALQCPERAGELAGLVYEKTQGNAFFVKQLLYSLYKEGVLSFDVEKQRWRWDQAAIQQLNITENVVDLMVARIRELPKTAQKSLSLSACIGNRFDLETLAIVSEESPQTTAQHLQRPLTEGLLIPQGERYLYAEFEEFSASIEYRFSHDRVQEAAYSLIPDSEKAALHLRIGTLLRGKISNDQQEERLFDIVNHLNKGRELLDDHHERIALAEFNLKAGQKAKESTAYHSALRYFTIGTELLSETSWENHHPLTFALHREWYECNYLRGHFDEAEKGFMPILEHTTSRLEKAEMYNIRIVQYTMLGKYEEAFRMGWNALKLFGIELSEHNVQAVMQNEFEDIHLNLGTQKVADLIHLPRMSNPVHQATLTLLINIIPPAYQNYPDVFRFIIARMVNLTLKHGTTQESCFGFVAYGVILGADSGQYRSGYEFGNVGVQLSDTFENSAQKCKPRHILGRFINHWRMPIQSSVQLLRQAFQYGVESGDVLNAGFTFSGLIQVLFSKGEHLDRVVAEIENGLDFARKTHNNLSLHICSMWRQFMLNLQGRTRDSGTFSDQQYHESQLLADMKKNSRQTYLFYILKLHSLYLYEHYAEALSMARETEPILHYLSGELSVAEQNLYHSLTLCALYQNAHEEEQRNYRRTLKTNQEQMQIWVDNCAENFQHKYVLIEAEIARIEGRKWDAVELYRHAIQEARKHEFIQYEALGNELLAKFWLAQGEEKISGIYMIDAHYGYQLWGAEGKVKTLEERYPQLFVERPETIRASDRFRKMEPTTSAESLPAESLDLAAVLKASQTLAGEIVLEKLLTTMMQIVMENAGAQKVLLLLEKNGRWYLEAEGRADTSDVDVLQSIPMKDAGEQHNPLMMPEAVVNYVTRTKEAAVLHDATREKQFASDPYIATHCPKSILCLPLLNQGALSGILYLENNLTTNAFMSDRVDVLQMLSSQAAISIEHAYLYSTLEQKVAERTRDLKKNIILFQQEILGHQETEKALRESEEHFRSVAQTAGDSIITVNERGNIIFWNPAAHSMFGYSSDEIVGQSLTMLMPERFREAHTQGVLQVVLTGESHILGKTSELTALRKDGTEFPIELSLSRWATQEGVFFTGMVHDIIERKQAEEALQQAKQAADAANQAKSEFLANMSHELRSPLNAILGYTQVLHRDAKLDEKQRKAVDVIQRSGEHLLMVISDVLDLSKIEARKLEISLADFHLRRCLESVADIARMRARQQGIAFKTAFDETLPVYVHGDEKCLRQVLLNLLNNAVKFTKQGEVTFRVHRNRLSDVPTPGPSLEGNEESDTSRTTHCRFEIRDTGIGIAAEHLEEIFLPFYQVNDPTIQHNGAGLGLAISHRLLQAMGGTLQAESPAGQGTCFWFELELAHAEGREGDFARDSRNKIGYTGRLRRVIIADDREENREVLKDTLLPLGFEVSEAANGRELIDKVLSHPPDLMLVDLMMPILNGFEAIRHIRQVPELEHIPIISISANAMTEIREEVLQAGAQEFLAKPIDFETLLEKLQRYLALEWLYGGEIGEETTEASVPEEQDGSLSPTHLPSREKLEILFQWAMRGDVHRLKEQARELEQSAPLLAPFAQQLYQLASAYQIDEIQNFLAQYMEDTP